ncbi:Hypothetical protein CAP_4184 [Chondromyces apiculatus DSM 436]|uniref:SnoaL-like domain-containing protein n=1 Tax=Chondromyces apiculatus DSM 436 TaxID=1192034 RepID=A0A017T666_9BACT|nr:Hypothetical protein CAP_4184 [Chondromyces apiculatus DSM 436]
MLGVASLGCGRGSPERAKITASAETEYRAAITAVLDGWHAAAAAADEEGYFKLLTPDAVFLGTDAAERWDVAAFRRYAHPHFARGRAWRFKAVRRDIALHPSGDVAWFDEDLATENLGPARGSGVLVHDGATGAWRIAQYNLALTVPNAQLAEVMRLVATHGSAPVPPAP